LPIDVKLVSNTPPLNPTQLAVRRAYEASLSLNHIGSIERNRGIDAMAKALAEAFDEILEANTLDLEMSREMAAAEIILDWLKLTPERLENTVAILRQLATLADPTQRLLTAFYQLKPAQTYGQLMPLGVIALVYEAIPELAAIAAGMCLKTGNSLILRGCSQTSHSNSAIAKILQNALEEVGLASGCLEFLSPEGGSTIAELVTQEGYIDLVIPYGRASLVQQIAEKATIPVLRSAIGNCYLHWSASGDFDLVKWAILDSYASEPDAVNAIEKITIDNNQKPTSLVRLFGLLQENGFQLRGDEMLVSEFPEYLSLAGRNEWGTAYLSRTIAFKLVENLHTAIDWIDRYSSGHADCIITESYEESQQFARYVDSALVYINTSPRFDRHPQGGDSIFLGISNQKGNRRGSIGLQSLTTYKQVMRGED
jgi:glutamate-5-semialdehyde dehydrogenase